MQQDALYTISNGLYVLASCGGGEAASRFSGSLVDAVSQIAVNPNLIMVSCMNTSCTKGCIEKAGEFAISVLPQDTAPELIATFGFQSSRNVNKWEQVKSVEVGGLPYLADALAKIRAKVVSRLEYPCNTVFIAEVVDAFDVRAGEPLTYKQYRGRYKDKTPGAWPETCAAGIQNAAARASEGKTTKTPPETPSSSAASSKHWTCIVCGYVYEGEMPFVELPEDWRCPLCGVGKDLFELR